MRFERDLISEQISLEAMYFNKDTSMVRLCVYMYSDMGYDERYEEAFRDRYFGIIEMYFLSHIIY